ncbi:TIGR03084 family metal-binding protein [Williamsia sterculiae]|uniref:TIGR03084 family protein n=1 Tax=Williamsia sterculiae TaxID=1344003 RepID=A0A1N7GPL0_9NOCA|nr:TIGR03084 family metal-binding protein [Williamsia sterculiae]SIS14512.1 TIGR03084 family protein [Williamsia sterculiae]
MSVLSALVDDLVAESASLDDLVADLDENAWRTPTPAAGWTIAHQIGHLSWTDRMSVIAATDTEGFTRVLEQAFGNPGGFVDEGAEVEAAQASDVILTRWREARGQLAAALLGAGEGVKLPWFGPPMSPASMATARIMETWAHGQDVADALGVGVEPTDRLRAVAHIGVRTRDFAYQVNNKPVPAAPFRVELTAPGGDLWTWGPHDADNRITGPALDFCRLVTQRRAVADLALDIVGDDAREWSTIAQCFAGPPGSGREPLTARGAEE